MLVEFCREFRNRASDCCFTQFPCLSDPGRRYSLGLNAATVIIHLIYLGALIFVDSDNIMRIAKRDPWYVGLYLLLFLGALVQYFVTSSSSPGYVVDAMRAVNEMDPLLGVVHVNSKQPAIHKSGGLVIAIEKPFGSRATTWTKLVMETYPPGSSARQWTCTYCNVLQPPRTKHCHDCDKCVLQFDHHCVWLGTCIGHGNHCRFWWYILEETTLCLWTHLLYIQYLKANILRSWWMDAMMMVLLVTLSMTFVFLVLMLLFHSYLALTNQTTYELVRRRRIPYMRGISARVYPFSKGTRSNLYNFCCAPNGVYKLEPLPTAQELEENNIPLTFSDVICCLCW